MVVLSFEVTGKPVASNIFVFINSVGQARRLEIEPKLEFLAILILEVNSSFFIEFRDPSSLAGNLNSLAIDGEVQTDTPAARPHFHMYSRCTVQMTSVLWLKGPEGSRRIVSQNTFTHPRVMFHLAPHNTLNTSINSLSPTSPVLLSSSSPNPDLLSTHPFIHCEDPRQDGNSTPPKVMSPRASSSTDDIEELGVKPLSFSVRFGREHCDAARLGFATAQTCKRRK